ncbi:hypothetical protein JL722_11025 [Aureococcus anophagefferens]|nr:hypothetical protein JL722_11025 [Aureococcus anophagefferens]
MLKRSLKSSGMLLLPASPRGRLRPVASCPDLARRAEVPSPTSPAGGGEASGSGGSRRSVPRSGSRSSPSRRGAPTCASARAPGRGAAVVARERPLAVARPRRSSARRSSAARISVPVVEGTWDEVRAALPAFGDDPPLVVVRGFAAGLLDDFGAASFANHTLDSARSVANRKRWYFTVPDYAPFMRPICLGFTAGCRFMMDPRNQSRVPSPKSSTGPGDLLVFPSFWPHAVANLDEGFGFGVGVRPRVARELFAAAAFPATARRSQLSPALNFALRHAYTAATRPAFYRDAVARLSGKFASLSTSLAVNSPELEAVALRAAAAVRLH